MLQSRKVPSNKIILRIFTIHQVSVIGHMRQLLRGALSLFSIGVVFLNSANPVSGFFRVTTVANLPFSQSIHDEGPLHRTQLVILKILIQQLEGAFGIGKIFDQNFSEHHMTLHVRWKGSKLLANFHHGQVVLTAFALGHRNRIEGLGIGRFVSPIEHMGQWSSEHGTPGGRPNDPNDDTDRRRDQWSKKTKSVASGLNEAFQGPSPGNYQSQSPYPFHT